MALKDVLGRVAAGFVGEATARERFLDAFRSVAADRGLAAVELSDDLPLAPPSEVALATSWSTPGQLRTHFGSWEGAALAGALAPGVQGQLAYVAVHHAVNVSNGTAKPPELRLLVRAAAGAGPDPTRWRIEPDGLLAGGKAGGDALQWLLGVTREQVDVPTGSRRSRLRLWVRGGEAFPVDPQLARRLASLPGSAAVERCDDVVAASIDVGPIWAADRAAIEALIAIAADRSAHG